MCAQINLEPIKYPKITAKKYNKQIRGSYGKE